MFPCIDGVFHRFLYTNDNELNYTFSTLERTTEKNSKYRLFGPSQVPHHQKKTVTNFRSCYQVYLSYAEMEFLMLSGSMAA